VHMWGIASGERLALWIILGGTLLTFLVRFFMTGSHIVIGDDTGTYLATLNFIRGEDLSGHGGERPPLVGYFLWPFVVMFGTLAGAKTAALVASVVGSFAFYLVAKKVTSPVTAAIGGLCFIWLPIYAETLGWGFLSILVIALALLSLWGWIRYAEEPSLDRALSAAAITAVMAYLNQTAVPVIGLVVGIALLTLVIPKPLQHLKFLIPAGVLLVFLTLGSIPYAMAHISNLSVPTSDGTPVDLSIELKDPITSMIAMVGILIFYLAGRKIGGIPGTLIMVGGIITSITQALTIPGSLAFITVLGRSILWLWMFAALVGIWGIPVLFRKYFGKLSGGQYRSFAALGIAFAFIYLSSGWFLRFESVMPHYTTLDNDSVVALEWVREQTSPDEKVGAYPLTLGFYVNGLANRATVTTSPDDGESDGMAYGEAVRGWWRVDDRAVRCTLGYMTECDVYLPELGVKYLLTRDDPQTPLSPVFSSGEMMVYRLEGEKGW